jgi:hypothetical protein
MFPKPEVKREKLYLIIFDLSEKNCKHVMKIKIVKKCYNWIIKFVYKAKQDGKLKHVFSKSRAVHEVRQEETQR